MKTLPIFLIIILSFSLYSNMFAQEAQSEEQDTTEIKTGWTFGGVPTLAYDTDLGYRYGGLVNFYYYGDGTTYPNYIHSIYLEWSKTTKGSGQTIIFYDGKNIFNSSLRLTADFRYLTEKSLDFFGFNGFEADYNSLFEDETDTNYISRMFYNHRRNMIRINADLQGDFNNNNLRWLVGFGYFNTEIGTIDIDDLNKGKDQADKLPDTTLLYDEYVNWGVIQNNEKNGGINAYLKAGIVFDTRDNEANPMKGLWEEALIIGSPDFMSSNNYGFAKLVLTHRQYFTLIKRKLSFAYRLSYQGTIAGRPPFYLQPLLFTSYQINNGLGGSNTLRGIPRNRVVGDGIAYANFEFRWKFYRFNFLKQNWYLALTPFFDLGSVVQKHPINYDALPVQTAINKQNDKLHYSTGCGMRIALNENFIVAIDYGKALKKQDGNSGLYIGLNFLF